MKVYEGQETLGLAPFHRGRCMIYICMIRTTLEATVEHEPKAYLNVNIYFQELRTDIH
jgi:hypothetical protein